MSVLVAGAGGFIGGHLVRALLERGEEVRAADIKWLSDWEIFPAGAPPYIVDLRQEEACLRALGQAAQVYNLAADMGGMGFIASHKADCMASVLINTNLLRASRGGVEHFFFSSSACVYAADKQVVPWAPPLTEADAYPADPEDGYGWEKLFSERMCRHAREDWGVPTRVARFHNVYGPEGAWRGGREKAPAAICRKVAEAKLGGCHQIEIWGDGAQTRSFLYIDDCVEGILALTASDHSDPLNIGSDRAVSINELVSMVEAIAGVRLERVYVDGPQGVRGRNSDNTRCKEVLGWQPKVSMEDGLERTYAWIEDQVRKCL